LPSNNSYGGLEGETMDITISISDIDEQALKNDLLDIQEWVQGAVDGKIGNCKKRMIAEWQPKLFADPDVENIPADETAFINLVVARDDYENRVQREQE